MPPAEIKVNPIAYELVGAAGPVWVVAPGGRYSEDIAGVREMAGPHLGSPELRQVGPVSPQKWAQETNCIAVKG